MQSNGGRVRGVGSADRGARAGRDAAGELGRGWAGAEAGSGKRNGEVGR